jgi:regulator of replication initiation timing
MDEKIKDMIVKLTEQLISIMQNNNNLLEENLRLYKEIHELRKAQTNGATGTQ